MTALSILAAARDSPRNLALARGELQLTYAELAERARSRMTSLAALVDGDQQGGIGFVALQAEESVASLELLLALFELGATVLPLHPRLTAFERERLLASLPVRTLVELQGDGVRALQLSPEPDELAARLLAREPQLAAIATSGTTGSPRIAVLSRRAFLASAEASGQRLGWTLDDRWLLALPIAHIGGLSVVTRCLIARRPVVLQRPRAAEAPGVRLARAIGEGAATLISLVPTQLDSLIELGTAFELPERVRVILTGGAATPAGLIAACHDRGWPVLTSYGLTEACSQVATQRPPEGGRCDAGVGPPLPGVIVELQQGVIHVRGPTLMSGYIGPDGAACDPEVGFRTCDLGRIDSNGCLHVLGRIDDAIITGGENVSPLEVEAVLEACPGVLEACVFGVADSRWGQVVGAALRVRETHASSGVVERAQLHVDQGLASFKRPRLYVCALEFVQNPNGKLDRRATAALLTPSLTAFPRA